MMTRNTVYNFSDNLNGQVGTTSQGRDNEGGELSPSRSRGQRSSASSIDCTNETTSTATTITEPSHDNHHHDAPLIDSSMMRTRTNFGDYQFYVPPETKASPRSAPTGPPVTANSESKRVEKRRVPQKLKLPLLNHPPDQQGWQATFPTSPQLPAPSPLPAPLDEKRLQFFEESPDLIPFDQVWNQQEFTLDTKTSDDVMVDEEEGEDEDPSDLRSEISKPFDEELPDRLAVSTSSAFSAFSGHSSSTLTGIPPPPPPPPPLPVTPSKQKTLGAASPSSLGSQGRLQSRTSRPSPELSASTAASPFLDSNNGRSSNASSVGSQTGRQPKSDPPGRENEEPPPCSPKGGDSATRDSPSTETSHREKAEMPSDEDERVFNGLEAQQRSLATASRGKTAENVGESPSAEDLGGSFGSPKQNENDDDNKSMDSLFDFGKLLSISPRSSGLSPQLSAGLSLQLSPPSEPPVSPKSPPKSPGKWRKRAPSSIVTSEDDDETSLDEPSGGAAAGGVIDLKTRAEEAFAARRRFSPRIKSPSPGPVSPRMPPSPLPQEPQAAVAEEPSSATLSTPALATTPWETPWETIAASTWETPYVAASTPTPAGNPVQAPTPPTPQRKNQVSFTATNTVHHFEHEYDLYSEQSESVLSSGTQEENVKTIGTDVEEAIRDIFMINALGACNPSPQRIRYHSDTRFERRDSEQSDNYSDDDEDGDDDEEEDTDTAGPSDDDVANGNPGSTSKTGARRTSDGAKSSTVRQVQHKARPSSEDLFFEAMMSMVEGGIGAMSAAFGFTTAEDQSKPEPVDTRTQPRVVSTPPIPSSPTKSPRTKDKIRRNMSPRRSSGSIEGVIDSVSDYILGPGSEKSEESSDGSIQSAGFQQHDVPDDERLNDPPVTSVATTRDAESNAPQDEREFDSRRAPMPPSEGEEDEPQSLEDDPRLLELAKQSALCMHEVLGVHYDESRGVDINDVKFVVVELCLPLGIIFQEDYSGCWITKIMPHGNADRSGKVEAGDQLAAINGKSSIGMKVDDICTAISDASAKSKDIELTFLRYIGPFRPLQSNGGGSSVAEDDTLGSYPELSQQPIAEDEKPRSTLSIASALDCKNSGKKKSHSPKSPKRGGLRKKFKWLSRGKKQATKNE